MKKISDFFYLKTFSFLVVSCSIYIVFEKASFRNENKETCVKRTKSLGQFSLVLHNIHAILCLYSI